MPLWHISTANQKASYANRKASSENCKATSKNHKVSSEDVEGFFRRALGSYTHKFPRKSLDSVYVSSAFTFRPSAFAFRSSMFVFVSEFRTSEGKVSESRHQF